MESSLSGESDGYDSGGDGMGTTTKPNSTPSAPDLTGSGRKRRASEEVVVLGNSKKQETWNQISTTVPELGGGVGTLTIPTRQQWFTYLSYLQKQYG